MNYQIVYKPIGKTVVDMIYEMREKYPGQKLAFSGRLDPMAHGYIYILFNETCALSKAFNHHDKIYNFKVLVGLSTDTTDILGLLENNNLPLANFPKETSKDIILAFENMVGEQEQEYHVFSSQKMNGVYLWKLARSGQLKDSEKNLAEDKKFEEISNEKNNFPSKKINIYALNFQKEYSFPSLFLKSLILKRINLLNLNRRPHFRFEEINKQWENFEFPAKEYQILEFSAKVSYGTYIRQLVKDVGKKLKIDLMVLEIERTELIFKEE